MLERYRIFAAYSRWANERVFDAAAKLADADYRADRGAFFKLVHGTLNHLLVGDRIWMRRFTGEGEMPSTLDAILYDDFGELSAARRAEDERISKFIGGLDEQALARELTYRTLVNPTAYTQPLHFALDHFFNHQTHHRGQAHGLITAIAGKDAMPSLDLLIYMRETGAGGIRKAG